MSLCYFEIKFRALDQREYLVIIRDNLYKNICCEPSSEPPQRDGSYEWSQHMILIRNKKIIIKYSLLSRAG